MFVELCKTFLEAINSDQVPTIENTWNLMCNTIQYELISSNTNL